jgi:hypothetical protein
MTIKNYYTQTFFTDELGNEINENATFEELFIQLDNYQDVYKYIGVYDSIVRERIFEKLANVIGVNYEYIYSQWLKGN